MGRGAGVAGGEFGGEERGKDEGGRVGWVSRAEQLAHRAGKGAGSVPACGERARLLNVHGTWMNRNVLLDWTGVAGVAVPARGSVS